MHFDTPPVLLVELNSEADGGHLTVSLESYLEFGDQLTLAVEALVERWQHLAAPAAIQSELALDRAARRADEVEADEFGQS